MAATREDVIEFLKNMTLLEASQLVKDLEETFGVSAAAAAVAAPMAMAGGGAEAAAAAEEKTEFDVILQAVGGAMLLKLFGRREEEDREFNAKAKVVADLGVRISLITRVFAASLMLVPALAPICLSGGPTRALTASGSLLLALAAIGLHTAAMLAVTGLVAAGIRRGVDGRFGRWISRARPAR